MKKLNMKIALTILMLLLVTIPICNSQHTVDDKELSFDWTKGTAPQHEYRYHISLSTTNKVFVIGGDNDGAFEVYDTKSDRWTNLGALPTPRLFLSGSIHDQSIYVIGGMDNSKKYTSVVEKYDLTNNKWTSCTALSVPRSRLASVTLNGKIYTIGGLEGTNDNNYMNSTIVEEYNPKTDSWTQKADMPTPRHGHSAVVYNDKILVVGGYTDSGPTGIVEEYDPEIDRWSTRSEMPTPRGFFGLVLLDNRAYAIAGRVRQDQGPIEQYGIENDSWTQLDPMPVWRNRFGITTLENKIYLIGGENNPTSVLIGEMKR